MNFNATVVHNKPMEQTAFHTPVQNYATAAPDKFEGSGTGFDVNDRTYDLSESMGTQVSFLSSQESASG